jgi:hypothetical protein
VRAGLEFSDIILCIGIINPLEAMDMADLLTDYRRIAVKGITSLEHVGRFTIRVFVQVRGNCPSTSSVKSRWLDRNCKILLYPKNVIVDVWHRIRFKNVASVLPICIYLI